MRDVRLRSRLPVAPQFAEVLSFVSAPANLVRMIPEVRPWAESPARFAIVANLALRACAKGQRLTGRQLEVALALIEAESTREAATNLGLEENTVYNYRKTIFDKTGLDMPVQEFRGRYRMLGEMAGGGQIK